MDARQPRTRIGPLLHEVEAVAGGLLREILTDVRGSASRCRETPRQAGRDGACSSVPPEQQTMGYQFRCRLREAGGVSLPNSRSLHGGCYRWCPHIEFQAGCAMQRG